MKKEIEKGFGIQVPPTKEQVNIYFVNAGCDEKEAEIFYRHYAGRDWKNSRGNLLQNWKKLAWTWALNIYIKKNNL